MNGLIPLSPNQLYVLSDGLQLGELIMILGVKEYNSTVQASFGRLLGRNFMSHFTVAFDAPAQ
jgi:hypothetical protein